MKTTIFLGEVSYPISSGYASISDYTDVNESACESAINAFKNFNSKF
ncbi:MAG: hypothetical protein ACRDDG_08040 [Cetobacterium sp.]